MITTRFQNHKEAMQPQHCPWCCDQGLVPTGTERSSSTHKGKMIESHVEVWGPCPNCELGLALENAIYPRGFWQGRSIEIEKQCRCGVAAHTAESKAAFEKAKEFLRSGLAKPDPDAQPIRHNPGQRLRPGGGGGTSGDGRAAEAVGTREPAVEASPGPGAVPAASPPHPSRVTPTGEDHVTGVQEEAQHHRCEAYDGRDLPWPQSKCEDCNPNEEITL